jgi:hypothetical protein
MITAAAAGVALGAVVVWHVVTRRVEKRRGSGRGDHH